MPKRETVCVLAKGKRDAIAWARQNGYDARQIVHPLTIDRIRGVVFSKIVVLPSFKHVNNRNALVKALKHTEARRYVKVKPEWIYVDEFERGPAPETELPVETETTEPVDSQPDGKAPEGTPPYPIPEGELPGQTDIFEQIADAETPQAAEGGETQADEPAAQDPVKAPEENRLRPPAALTDLDDIFKD